MEGAAWADVMQLFREWHDNPPIDLLAQWHWGYEPKPLPGAPTDKFFGDDALPPEQKERQAPSIVTAPPEIQQILEHFMTTRGTNGA